MQRSRGYQGVEFDRRPSGVYRHSEQESESCKKPRAGSTQLSAQGDSGGNVEGPQMDDAERNVLIGETDKIIHN
jgi:hypothetical protein